MSDDEKTDYYDLLGVLYNSTSEQIDKAYRRKALVYHPDKNKDNPEAAVKIFHQITKAYETLSDPQTKRDYDNARKARLAVKARHEAMGTKRKAMREELEKSEKAAKQQKPEKTTPSGETLEAKKERLRQETAQKRAERQKRLNQIAAERRTAAGAAVKSSVSPFR